MTRPAPHNTWDGILDKDEIILWQDRPDGAFHINGKDIPQGVASVMFAGFAAIWMMLASEGGGFFWLFGLIHFSIGLAGVFNAFVMNTIRRRHSWYSLSTKRAYIATDLPWRGRRLAAYPITAESRLELLSGRFDTIWFAERSGNSGRRRIGFERLANARPVYQMMRDIQRRQRQGSWT